MTDPARPEKLKRVVIKEELVTLLDGCYIKALILNQFLYWSERTKDVDKFLREEKARNTDLDIEPTHGWIYKSCEELADEIMIGKSPSTMRRYLGELVKLKYLQERNNPHHAWDRTLQYRPDILRIQSDLQSLGYALEGYPLLIDPNNPPFFKIENASPKIENGVSKTKNQTADSGKSIVENKKAIPETTIEPTSKTTVEDKKESESDFTKYFGDRSHLNPATADYAAPDGYQYHVDKANGNGQALPADDVAQHLYWGIIGYGAPLPADKKQRGKWVSAANKLLGQAQNDFAGLLPAIDAWFEEPPASDKWTRDHINEPNNDKLLNAILAYYWRSKSQPASEPGPATPEEMPAVDGDRNLLDNLRQLFPRGRHLLDYASLERTNGHYTLSVPADSYRWLARLQRDLQLAWQQIGPEGVGVKLEAI